MSGGKGGGSACVLLSLKFLRNIETKSQPEGQAQLSQDVQEDEIIQGQ